MSQKNSNTTSDYIEWNEATNLVHRLYSDGNYRMSMFIGLGIFTGLRVSDLKRITWSMILSDEFEIVEQKTGKRRQIRVNKGFQRHAMECYKALGILNDSEACLKSPRGESYSTQRLNVLLKEIKAKYRVKCPNISCHSLRKCYGRKIYLESSENASLALATLSELFNHSSVNVTKRYLGIRKEELLSMYALLSF